MKRFLLLAGLACQAARPLPAEEAAPAAAPAQSAPIDLPAALRLAGANNLDVKLARERLAQAEAAHASTREQFFPWITPAVVASRHSGNVQAFNGPISAAQKQALAAGLAVNAQLDLGDAIFQNLAAKQRVRASTAALAAQQRQTIYEVAAAYFDLAAAKGGVSAAAEASRIATEQVHQVSQAADAGIVFKGDVYRVQSAYQRSELARRQWRERQRIRAARLAELLHLDPAIELIPSEENLVPLALLADRGNLGELMAHALAVRPEVDAAAARLAAAQENRRGATYAPLIPSLGLQAGTGYLGGGAGYPPLDHDLNVTHDYLVGLSWRVGPGGLFDPARRRAAQAEERSGMLEKEKVAEGIRREVVEQYEHLQSLADQVRLVRQALAAAESTVKLSGDRRAQGVSAVLEDLLAHDELARSQQEYLAIVADYNKAQYALRFSVGD